MLTLLRANSEGNLMATKDTISSIIVFLFALSAFALAKDFGGGSELFPRGLAVIMMVISVIMFVRSIVWPQAVPEGVKKLTRTEAGTMAICVVVTTIYIALISPLGFATASILFIAATSYVLGMRNHLAIWGTAAVFVGILYYVFVRIFHTPLPRELIFNLFS